MYHRESWEKCNKIKTQLEAVGIITDWESGKILYNAGKQFPVLNCKTLYLLRHGNTFGTQTKSFMSDTSENARLTDQAVACLRETAWQIELLQFDDIFYAPIPRVKETFQIIQKNMVMHRIFTELSFMKGINNAGWENKTRKDLEGRDQEDFYQREVLHNIFAKSAYGTSWGETICNCITLVQYLNKYCRDRKVLLISQGSVLRGLQIVLHFVSEPWEGYDTDGFFSLKSGDSNYGKLQLVYCNQENDAKDSVNGKES